MRPSARLLSSLATVPALAGVSALAVLALPRALAQDTGDPADPAPDAAAEEDAEPRGLQRVFLRPDGGGDGRALEEQALDAEAWRADLTQPDLDARLEAFDRAVARAAGDAALRAWLEETAAGDGELAWTARLALRAAERRGGHAWFDPFGRGHDLDALERRIEEMTQRLAPGWNRKLDPFAIPFPSLLGPAAPPPGASAGQSKRVEIQNDADGWRIKITEEVDGETKVREIEGETLEEILEANPELKEEVGISGALLGPGLQLRIGSPDDQPFDFEELFGRLGERPRGFGCWRERREERRPGSAEPVRTDILGVIARPASEEEGGEGLYVRQTVPGTIATLLGIVPGDVLLEVNGRPLEEVDDVTRALAERGEDGRVAAAWRDGSGRRRTATWRP